VLIAGGSGSTGGGGGTGGGGSAGGGDGGVTRSKVDEVTMAHIGAPLVEHPNHFAHKRNVEDAK